MNININLHKTEEYKADLEYELQKNITYSNAAFFARKLGAHVEGKSARFLIWHTEISRADKIIIELFIPVSDLIYDKPDQHSNVLYYQFESAKVNDFSAIVIDGLPVGNRNQFGAFYQYELTFDDGAKKILRDPMAWSMPYGINAPAELYDVNQVLAERKDVAYYKNLAKEFDKNGNNRISPSTNILEIHTGTATLEGTFHSLANRYQQIASAITKDDLSPDSKNLLGFDAVQLMPIEPVIEHPVKHKFWNLIQTPDINGSEVTVHLRKPTVTNWGYDVVLFGSGAINPSLLSTGRPHELLELIETLHNFPTGPIKIIIDVVFGHADNQALQLLPEDWFAGPNIYGQNINYKHPLVRAMILEMQRRKVNWGIDGLRIDGSQDIRYYDADQDQLLQDDDFLKQMSAVEQTAAGVEYKPWMIFEDGRPWPRDDWELASTYRDIIDQQKHPHQWAPTIFSYNTPYRYTYWVSKWWRIRELLSYGEKWVSGYANHDTVRRGTQANPEKISVNYLLGNSLKMVMDNAYNNPSTTLLTNAFLPGVPMDFLQALSNTPWSFIRNTDRKYAVKIAAEEAFFSEWQITEIEYRNTRFFKRLKNFGFNTLFELRRFAKILLNLVDATNHDPENIAVLLNHLDPPLAVQQWTPEKLMSYAELWMADLFEYCNADMHTDNIDPRKATYNLQVRKYRLANPWISENFKEGDFLKYREPVDGAVIYYGYRKHLKTGKELIFLANMEGQPRQVIPTNLGLPVGNAEAWSVALSTPSVRAKKINQPLRLSISQGILFEKKM